MGFFPILLAAFDFKPWNEAPWHISLDGSYEYAYFPNVSRRVYPINYSSHENDLGFLLDVPFSPSSDIQAEITFNEARSLDFNFDTAGFLFKHQFYNDIAGDPISLATYASLVFSPHERISNVVTTLHNMWNFTIGAVIGKEKTRYDDWANRWWLGADFGMANQGYPWFHVMGNLELKFREKWIAGVGLLGYFGLAGTRVVDIADFNGWGNIGHQSLDLEVKLQRLFGPWGKLSVSYLARAFAYAYPKGRQGVLIYYHYPFDL